MKVPGGKAKYTLAKPYMVTSPHTWWPGQPAGQLVWGVRLRGGACWEDLMYLISIPDMRKSGHLDIWISGYLHSARNRFCSPALAIAVSPVGDSFWQKKHVSVFVDLIEATAGYFEFREVQSHQKLGPPIFSP